MKRIFISAMCSMATVAGIPGTASASPYTEVASAFDEGDNVDIHASLSYQLSLKSAAIKREFSGLPDAQPGDPVPVAKDLKFSSSTHIISPRVEFGFFHGLSLSVEMPVTISHNRTLSFDQDANPCVFPGESSTPTCINADNSRTIQDGLLPETGFDANDVTGPGFTDPSDATIFRSPTRYGLDQVHLGLTWAPMNQQIDSWKPTWKIGAEFRLSIGSLRDFNRQNPGSGISRGVHEVMLFTSMAKKMGWAEPYWEIYYIGPIGTRGTAFNEPGFGQTSVNPMQRGGTSFGFQGIAWQNESEGHRVSIDVSALIQGRFEGRDYSEMWEVFAYAGDASALGPLTLDRDPVTPGQQALSHPGVTNIENYLSLGGRLAVEAELGPLVRFGAGGRLFFDQSHLITYADAGKDSADNDLVVTPGTGEVNPLHVPLVDLVGRRYLVDDVIDFTFDVYARLLF